jgi:hypothetical protein
VDVRWTEFENGTLMLRWMVNGLDALVVPAFGGKGRADELWTTTCFELFLKDFGGTGYEEFNFSPSQRWAAYRFADTREGMREAPLDPEPAIDGVEGDQLFVLTVTLDKSVLNGAGAAGLCAVIEEKCGRKSYWALHHGKDEPDFHDPACFAVPLR